MNNPHPPAGSGAWAHEDQRSAQKSAKESAQDPDFSEPIVFRRTTTKRLHEALWAVAVLAGLTLIASFQGGDAGGILRFGIMFVLLVSWTAALLYLISVVRYTVELDEQGVTVFQGFLRRQVLWDDAFIAEWKARHTCVEEEITHTTWILEMRDAAGQVKLRVDGDMLDPHDRRLLGHLVLRKLEAGRDREA